MLFHPAKVLWMGYATLFKIHTVNAAMLVYLSYFFSSFQVLYYIDTLFDHFRNNVKPNMKKFARPSTILNTNKSVRPSTTPLMNNSVRQNTNNNVKPNTKLNMRLSMRKNVRLNMRLNTRPNMRRNARPR